MIVTASLSLLALISSALLTLIGWGAPLAVAHLAFAVGIVPLIFAAMMHFVPVLTRTGDVDSRIVHLPNVAQGIGLLAVLSMQGVIPFTAVYLAVVGDLLLAAILVKWIMLRAGKSLGSPHPGWRWYGMALGCLIVALLAVLLVPFCANYWQPLRLFHMHLNMLGLVGLAALGTLPVLMPTALKQPDPEAAGWLRRRLWLVASGALVVAMGVAIDWPFAAPGALLILVTALGLAGQWSRRFGLKRLVQDGVGASLLCSVIGLILSLLAGLLHGAGLFPARPSLAAWGAGFLLPLVSGALSQLLPVWRWPGPVIPARDVMRHKLAASGALRSALFLAASIFLIVGWHPLASAMLLCGLVFFVIGLVQGMRVQPSTR